MVADKAIALALANDVDGLKALPPTAWSLGRSVTGVTPLMAAAGAGARDVTQFLLQSGVAPDSTASDGKTAAMIAAANLRVSALELLLDAGANPNIVDVRGETALMLALRSTGRRRWMQTTVNLLLVRGANPLIKNAAGQTAADIAARRQMILRLPFSTRELHLWRRVSRRDPIIRRLRAAMMR